MSKIEVNQAAEIIKKHKIDPATLREIIEEMNEATQPDADEDIKPPAPKKQFVVLLSDPTGKIRERIDANNLVGWVVQIPEDCSPHSTVERIFKGAYDFNASKKGRLLPVKSVGEALESASAKYFKESELWVKTRLPVAIMVTDNVLPKDEFKIEKVDRRSKQTVIAETVPDRVDVSIKMEGSTVFDTGSDHALLVEAKDVIAATGKASTSVIQRRLRIGYNRAAKLMEELERLGFVGPENGSSPREILVDLAVTKIPPPQPAQA